MPKGAPQRGISSATVPDDFLARVVEALHALPAPLAADLEEKIRRLPTYLLLALVRASETSPSHTDLVRLAAIGREHFRPMGPTTLRRQLAFLPRKFIGRCGLYPTVAALAHIACELAAAPEVAGNVPPPRSRGGAADAGSPAVPEAA